MTGKRNTKPIDGVSFAEFARLINRSKGYISQMKPADRLVLTADGKRVLVDESITKLKSTKDIGKWPVTIFHQQAREKKRSDEQASTKTELIPDPYDDFMADLLTDSGVEIVAGLMADVGLSFHDASIAFNEMGCCLADIRESQGYKTTFEDIPNPLAHRLPPELQAQIKAEIEERVRELELLADEPL